jgi:hypothetical protein
MTMHPVPTTEDEDPPPVTAGSGSKDGLGSGDHDQPYTFGRRPRLAATYPFNAREYARLLVLRGLVRDGLRASDDIGLGRRAAKRAELERPILTGN